MKYIYFIQLALGANNYINRTFYLKIGLKVLFHPVLFPYYYILPELAYLGDLYKTCGIVKLV